MVVGAAGPTALGGLTAVGTVAGVAPKVIAIGWVAFLAMAIAVPFGSRAGRRRHARRLVWGYGLASGAMITSAAVFLLPAAIDHHVQYGGYGVALGVIAGFAAHTVGHRLTHLDVRVDRTTVELTAHAVAAGAIIGVVYAAMPALGPLLGLAIVSHKAPAGYAAARRLRTAGKPVGVLLLPASGVGVAAILTGLVALPADPRFNAVVFGFAAGVFLHVAMDFLPRCETGSEVSEVVAVTPDAHDLLDRLRLHAVTSTVLGGLAVYLAWLALSIPAVSS